jgi:hypothetical protein
MIIHLSLLIDDHVLRNKTDPPAFVEMALAGDRVVTEGYGVQSLFAPGGIVCTDWQEAIPGLVQRPLSNVKNNLILPLPRFIK